MHMAQFRTLKSSVVVLPVDNIDTDQIIPARFLKATTRSGMGEALFADWRRLPDGSLRPDFPLNRPEMQGAQILLAGDNFGCGSSREHAPWALVGSGFRAIVSTSFADIFQNNALKNGLLPVPVPVDVHQALVDHFSRDASAELEIDLQKEAIRMPDGTSTAFHIDPFARRCLLDGVDELGYLLNLAGRINDYEQNTAVRPC